MGLASVAISLLETLDINSFYGRQATYEIFTVILIAIGLNESRYIFQKLPLPRLTWYYDAFGEHELNQTILGMMDGLEERMSEHLAEHKDQMDYYLIHKEYHFVKKRILSQYLENERIALTQHYNNRTINLLNNIKALENNNVKQEINSIAEQSLASVLETVNNSSKNQDILKASFESALEGLKSGKMEYKNDKVIPLFIEELAARTKQIIELSPEEENKKFSLTAKQREYLANMDTRAAQDYAAKLPEVGTSLSNTSAYKEVCDRIKRRAEQL